MPSTPSVSYRSGQSRTVGSFISDNDTISWADRPLTPPPAQSGPAQSTATQTISLPLGKGDQLRTRLIRQHVRSATVMNIVLRRHRTESGRHAYAALAMPLAAATHKSCGSYPLRRHNGTGRVLTSSLPTVPIERARVPIKIGTCKAADVICVMNEAVICSWLV
jgi:hypothetical protein